ncbi:hypothetical protein MC885_007571, partial [Smutsia gigantea]
IIHVNLLMNKNSSQVSLGTHLREEPWILTHFTATGVHMASVDKIVDKHLELGKCVWLSMVHSHESCYEKIFELHEPFVGEIFGSVLSIGWGLPILMKRTGPGSRELPYHLTQQMGPGTRTGH